MTVALPGRFVSILPPPAIPMGVAEVDAPCDLWTRETRQNFLTRQVGREGAL